MAIPYVMAEIERRRPSRKKTNLRIALRNGKTTRGEFVVSVNGYVELKSLVDESPIFVPWEAIDAVVATWP